MRHFILFIFSVFCLSANAQWEVVPSGTDSALYCVSSNDDHFFVGGATGMLLKSPTDELEFENVQEEYGTDWDYAFNQNSITKIGVLNDSTLLYHYNYSLHDVADSNTVYTYWAGASVGIDSNLVIISEERTQVVVDTSVIEYWTDPWLLEPGELADIGTIAWVLRSLDGTDSYDLGTAFETQIYTNSTHCANAQYVGCIDYYGNLLFSNDSAQTFAVYDLPGVSYNFDINIPATDDFTAAGFYFNDDLVGFYAPAAEAASSLYKLNLENGTYQICEISPDYIWNRITMVDSQFVIAVGDSGMVASSSDQGETWTVENIGTELNLYGVDSDGEGNLIIVGDSGLILTNSDPLVDFIEISSEEDLFEIGSENGTLQLAATVFPESAPQNVSWSMVNLSGTATIDQNGLVTAQGDGLVMAVAELPEPPGFTGINESKTLTESAAHFFIQITGQELEEQYLLGADTTICGSDILTVTLPAAGELEWSDGSTESTFEISEDGTYWVTLTDEDFIRSDTIQVFQLPYPEFTLGDDVTACTGDEINLEAPIPFSSYEWSTGSDANIIAVTETGDYSLGITVSNCTSYDEISVTFLGVGDFDLGDDISFCEGENAILSAPEEGAYTWSDGSDESEITVDEEGWVVLEITEGECAAKDSLFVTVDPLPQFDLGADTTICDTASLLLDALVDGGLYEWNDGSNEPTLEVNEEGIYAVTVTLGNCSAEDAIEVSLQNCTLSLEEVLSRKVEVYPNPAHEFVVVELPAGLTGSAVSIYTNEGRKVFSQIQNSQHASYSLNQLASGNYHLVFELNGFQFSREVIKR